VAYYSLEATLIFESMAYIGQLVVTHATLRCTHFSQTLHPLLSCSSVLQGLITLYCYISVYNYYDVHNKYHTPMYHPRRRLYTLFTTISFFIQLLVMYLFVVAQSITMKIASAIPNVSLFRLSLCIVVFQIELWSLGYDTRAGHTSAQGRYEVLTQSCLIS
jgi:hypothetical protein